LYSYACFFFCVTVSKVRFENFADCKNDFRAVSDFLRSYYDENGFSDKVVFDFEDSKIIQLGATLMNRTVVCEVLIGETTVIQNNGFTFAWVEADSVIFFEDETKHYGVLFSEKARNVISSLDDSWYEGIESKKLDKNWYEIGVLDAI